MVQLGHIACQHQQEHCESIYTPAIFKPGWLGVRDLISQLGQKMLSRPLLHFKVLTLGHLTQSQDHSLLKNVLSMLLQALLLLVIRSVYFFFFF
jgi:hypothetical protein